MTEFHCKGLNLTELRFKELVACYTEDGYIKVHGWTESTGRLEPWKYDPTDWEYDPAFEDVRGGSLGFHGGCPNCIMTLVHLRKLSAEPEPSTPEPSKTPSLMLSIVLIVLYLCLKR